MHILHTCNLPLGKTPCTCAFIAFLIGEGSVSAVKCANAILSEIRRLLAWCPLRQGYCRMSAGTKVRKAFPVVRVECGREWQLATFGEDTLEMQTRILTCTLKIAVVTATV